MLAAISYRVIYQGQMGKYMGFILLTPPWVRPLTWADPLPNIVTNNTKHLSHPWGPQVGQGSVWAKYNYTSVTTQLIFV